MIVMYYFVFLCSNLINESLLTASVRCVLADVLLQAYHVSCDLSHDIVLRRNKTESTLYCLLITCNYNYLYWLDGVSIEQMLISMLNDSHHSVRIKMAKVISSLFKRGGQTLPFQLQENLFEKIKIELDHTNMVQVCMISTCVLILITIVNECTSQCRTLATSVIGKQEWLLTRK